MHLYIPPIATLEQCAFALIINRSKLWRENHRNKNPEAFDEYHRNYYQNNKTKLSSQNKMRYVKNRERILAREKIMSRVRYAKNRLQIIAKQKIRKAIFPEKRREIMNRCIRKKRATNPVFRMMLSLRCRIPTLLKAIGESKKSPFWKLVGCSKAELKLHLEKQFTQGMGWHNYGKDMAGWHVDHKTPISKFNLSDPEEIKRCFHFSNLQPLWARDNLSKSNKTSAL